MEVLIGKKKKVERKKLFKKRTKQEEIRSGYEI